MFSNSNAFPQDASAFQPSSAPRGRIDRPNQADFQNTPPTLPNQTDMNQKFPQSAQQLGNPYAENSFIWNAPSEDKRQMQPPFFNPQQLERRLRQIERQQDLFQRELQNLDRRVRSIERRLGFPVPPIGMPGFPPR
ncbi:hypothetical protein NIE88_03770 [Sporolactobacillus shoreicorticis]|uniref:Uncharacterized protein n=1 Tax=Sporolactobacillus shoreicorticis TaxID=1923877 RepID=A0ABW5S0N7_9BACL|nr:hypothetical protein [Sporolactobacillus shoreicorticis]MCO7124893.1 hypothetical protein [Sporolactobacillus shoreicorticis]